MPVAVELKTCQLPRKVYEKYALTACRRTPVLRCPQHVNNCERARHCLQAGYSALALQLLLNAAYVKSFVLVQCCDGPILIPVASMYYNWALYTRQPGVHAIKSVASASAKPKTKRAVSVVVLPAACRRALLSSGLHASKTCIAKNVAVVSKSGQKKHGIAIFAPTWLHMQRGAQQKVIAQMHNCARKCKVFAVRSKVSLYAVSQISRTSKQLTVQLITAPFMLT